MTMGIGVLFGSALLNGVRLTVKPTTFRDEQILVSVRTGLGELSLPTDRSTPLAFGGFEPGAKDMLDAIVAAVTVKEFTEGRGCEIGGGDGFGTMVLPRQLNTAQVSNFSMKWPE